MGRKPFLGMVSAFCVGLALTGCRDADKRQEGPLLSKNSTPAYKAQPAFGQGAAKTDAQTTGWNTAPPSKSATRTVEVDSLPPAPSMDHSAPRGADAFTAGRTGAPNIQTTGAMGPLPPPPPQPVAGETSSHFAPAHGGEIHDVPGVSGQSVLPPVPALAPGPMNLPPGLPEPPLPPPVKREERGAPPLPAPPPQPSPAPAVHPDEPSLPPLLPEPVQGPLAPPPAPPTASPGALPPPPPPPPLPPLPPPPAPPNG